MTIRNKIFFFLKSYCPFWRHDIKCRFLHYCSSSTQRLSTSRYLLRPRTMSEIVTTFRLGHDSDEHNFGISVSSCIAFHKSSELIAGFEKGVRYLILKKEKKEKRRDRSQNRPFFWEEGRNRSKIRFYMMIDQYPEARPWILSVTSIFRISTIPRTRLMNWNIIFRDEVNTESRRRSLKIELTRIDRCQRNLNKEWHPIRRRLNMSRYWSSREDHHNRRRSNTSSLINGVMI